MVCGIIGNYLYAQHGNKLHQFPISWSNQQTVPARGRRASEVAQVPERANEGMSVTASAVMWTADGVAVAVLAVVVATMMVTKAMRFANVDGFVGLSNSLFVDAGGYAQTDSDLLRYPRELHAHGQHWRVSNHRRFFLTSDPSMF